jgi:PAS domain S-box-containing protein
MNNKDRQALEAVFSSSFDGLWLIDHTGTVVMINQGAERIHQLNKKDVIGKDIRELSEMQVMDRSITLEVFRHKSSLTINQTLPRIDKEILVTATPVFGDNGELKFVVVLDRDVTELVRLRRELKAIQKVAGGPSHPLPMPLKNEALQGFGIVVSEAMKRVYRQAMQAASSDSTIMLMGESGVGKGYLAAQIHNGSLRKNDSLIHLNCGALPQSLIDSELFGYERGAFTGARQEGKPGFLEAAADGTLFLDEISELPFSAQVKLLQFLDTNEFIRVGGTTARKSNARIIAATNRDLEEMVHRKEFRKDLYFRLNVVPLRIPPLRERRESLPWLIDYFLKRMNARNQREKRIHHKAMHHLCQYDYPGNVRELAHLVEQLVVLSPHDEIGIDDLPQHILSGGPTIDAWTVAKGWNLKTAQEVLEREMICKALHRFGSQRKAADFLGIHQSTLARKIEKLGISSDVILHPSKKLMQYCK